MKNLKILIVEDEILIAEMLKDYLIEVGHEITGMALSYEEALQAFNLRKPDLILLDIRLYGEKSGINLAQELLSRKENTPIIYLSSQYDQRTMNHALDTHPYGYLTKPIKKETLWTSIETAHRLSLSTQSASRIIELYDGKVYHNIKVEDFLYAEAQHVYVHVFLIKGQDILMRTTLKDLISLLGKENIWQCHRSYIVNLNHIKIRDVETVSLVTGKTIPVSRSRKNKIE